IPGSNRGMPASLGPPGTRPSQSRAPIRTPRYHFSEREASEGVGASGFGAPKSRRAASQAIAHPARTNPTATASDGAGALMKEPPNTITPDAKVAAKGTPTTAPAAARRSQLTTGIRPASPRA